MTGATGSGGDHWSIGGYPTTVAFLHDASPLPLDHACGPASLLYSLHRPGSPYYLVAQDGRQYLVPANYSRAEPFAITLSPDGRWLAWTDGNDFRLRDLTGVAVRRVERNHPGYGAIWSSDNRWLLLDGPHAVYWMVDVHTGAVDDVRDLPDDACVGVSSDGSVLQWNDQDLRFQWVDPRPASQPADAPRTIRPIHVAPGRQLEYPKLWPLLSPDCQRVIVPMFRARSSFDPYFAPGPTIALVLCDLGDGHVIKRFDLSGDCSWQLLAYRPEGIVLLRHQLGRSELAVLDRSGQLHVVCTMPAAESVVIPGTTQH